MRETPFARALVIGDPIDHSLSPTLHNAGYRALELQFCMEKRRITPENLPALFSEMRALRETPTRILGLAITMPLKVAALNLVDRLEEAASAIGAINTVYLSPAGELVGTNTDWLGIKRPIESKRNLSGAQVAILGAGGAALAAMHACVTGGGHVTLFNRNRDKALPICKKWGAVYQSFEALTQNVAEFDIIINATPVGMVEQKPDPSSPSSPSFDTLPLHSGQLVFETIYSPLRTPLVIHAESRGCTVIRGDEMFLEQALAQFTLHTGLTAPRLVMANALREALASPQG